MPRYDYRCTSCTLVHEQIHRMNDQPDKCPLCGSKRVTKVIGLVAIKPAVDSGWEGENGGRGRYISQLQAEPGKTDPGAFARSQSDAIDKAKRRGFKVTKVR